MNNFYFKFLSFIFLVSLVSLQVNGQVKFENGYFVDKNGDKKECLIKNFDWQFNPESFEYKESEDAPSKTLTVMDTREFSIGANKKYISAFIKIDSSSDVLSKSSTQVAPHWYNKQVFVKVLANGNMSLYSYRTPGYHRFYYKMKSDSITPLVYKRYFSRSSQIGYNKQYIMQLEKLLDCGDLSKKANVNYTAEALTNLTALYNQCTNSEVKTYSLEKKLGWSAKITAGVSSSKYKAYSNGGFITKGTDFEQILAPRIGLEVEMLLPYWDNRWSIVFDPNYRTYKSEVTVGSDKFSVDYTSIEIPVGLRTHFFLKKSNQIFADVYFVGDKHLGSTKLNLDGSLYDEKSAPNYALSIGFSSKRIGFAVRAYSLRNIASEYVSLNNSYKCFSLIASYNIFTTAD